MAITPVEWNSVMSNTQDYTSVRHQEEMKGMVDQTNFQSALDKEVKDRVKQVHGKDDAQMNQKKYDAKEKGSNQYSGDGGAKRRKKEVVTDRVTVKGMSHFDMTV